MPNLIRRGMPLETFSGQRLFEPFRHMQEAMRDMMREVMQSSALGEVEMLPERGVAFAPRTELKETPNAFEITAEVPGVKAEDRPVEP